MCLKLEPVALSDFDEAEKQRYFEGGDLVGAPISTLCWPVKNQKEATFRLKFYMHQQRQRFLKDPTTRFMKVIDMSTHEIVSLARWHYYEDGYKWTGKTWQDMDTINAPGWTIDLPTEFNRDVYDLILVTALEGRTEWHGPGPSWVLMAMITREPDRKRGAASMLIEWGIEQAQKDGVPAYLEASKLGRPVYERCGFETVGPLIEFDCRSKGIDQIFLAARMRRHPQA